MTSTASYHYPAPPDPSAADIDMSQSTYAPTNYAMPPQTSPAGSLGESQDSSMSFNNSSDPNHVLKRSYSTPSVGAPSNSSSEQQTSAGASGEKKRNKLGYHRTSIACSHCRRRKIRCIASPDVQNRCMNCIRLKKECSFYPVDQQPMGDTKLPTQAPPGSSNVPTASSSPAIPGGSPAELTSHQQPYPPMPVPQVPNMGTPTIQTPGGEYFPPDGKATGITVPLTGLPTEIQYGMREQPAANWMTTDANGNPISKSGEQNMAWRSYPAESPISGQFAPYSHAPAAATTWTTSDTESGGEAMAWSNMPPPGRSMSFSGELMSSQQASQYYQMGQNRSYERQPGAYADMYAPTMGVAMGGMDAGAGQALDPTAGPMVAGVVPSSNPMSWQQPQQQLMSQQQQPQHQMPYSRRGDEYGAWGYGDGGGGGTHHM
ncbi:hypothetical protein PT974_09017 [Cladobotryum mycophilum]|uniref:Zn(2)-C6 fungal-type domain-containing protein n=1 Tax=Cladobotryum mycophilum TaxID=491253 RepID=A0ABR0SEZ8_9HYPO